MNAPFGLELAAHWWWLIVAVLLAVGEIVIPGIFLIWVAIAAALTALVAFVLPIGFAPQVILFAILSVAATYSGRRWYADNPVPSQDPLLNDRAARLIGKTVTIAEPIRHGSGRVKVGDGVWPATGPDMDQGASARVTGVRDGTLVVEPLS